MKILKFERVNTDFSSPQRDWEEFEQSNTSIFLNIFILPQNSEEKKLAYRSNYNDRENQIILLMTNDKANNHYYFAAKKLARIKFFGVVQR